MYKETLKAKELNVKSKLSQEQIDTKVNRICDAFLAVLEQAQYKDDHLQNIITAHVSKVPPALEAGLEMIGRLQGKSMSASASMLVLILSTETRDPLMEKAAEHICFLADVNQLYDTSLGLYNLDLALLIAQQSQKVSPEFTRQNHSC
jgi:elongator complex protein 1